MQRYSLMRTRWERNYLPQDTCPLDGRAGSIKSDAGEGARATTVCDLLAGCVRCDALARCTDIGERKSIQYVVVLFAADFNIRINKVVQRLTRLCRTQNDVAAQRELHAVRIIRSEVVVLLRQIGRA